MKKFLLTTTAIVGIASYSSQSFADIQVKLGGFNEVQFGVWDDDRENQTGREFRNHTEIHLDVNGTTDKGFRYGIDIELISSGGDIDFDENHLFIASEEFGQVQLGDEDGASDILAVTVPVRAGSGHIDGDYSGFSGGFATDIIKTFDSGDSTKVTYYTPKFHHDPHANPRYGLQAGISYTPENDSEGLAVVQTEPATGLTDMIEFGVNYLENIDGIDVVIGFTGARFTQRFAAEGDENFFNWQVGAQASYLGLTVGGGYVDFDDHRGYSNAFHVGAEYANGPLTFGGAYGRVLAEQGSNESLGNFFGVAATYKVVQGISVLADLVFRTNDVDNPNVDAVFGTENNEEIDLTVTFLFGVKIAF